jgi:predicted secreted protein
MTAVLGMAASLPLAARSQVKSGSASPGSSAEAAVKPLHLPPNGRIPVKLTTLAAALVMNGLLMGAVGYLFEIQSHPHMSVISFAKAVAKHQWFS